MKPAAHDPRDPSRPIPAVATSPGRGRFKPRWRDGDVLVALLILGITSAVRVVGAAVRHEVFGTEATLALMSVVFVPCILFRARPRAEPRRARDATRPSLRLMATTRSPGRPTAEVGRVLPIPDGELEGSSGSPRPRLRDELR